MARFGSLDTQYFDDAGDPLVSGKIYFYETGTTTPKDTFADVSLTIPNTNPVILTAAGRQPNIFFEGVAKAILTKSDNTQILVRDPVGETESSFGDPWIASKTYSAADVVQGSDGQFYRSLINSNVNNNPVTTSGSWDFLYSIQWSAGTTYTLGSLVTYNQLTYQSLQAGNLNKNPASEIAWWTSINLSWSSTATYGLNANVIGTNGILYTSIQAGNTGNNPLSSPLWWIQSAAAQATVNLATQVSGVLGLANGGTGSNLTDPNADRILFWDDSATATAFLTPGSGLSISGTTMTAGISNVVTSSSNYTFTSTPTLLLATPTGQGMRVTLPDATTMSVNAVSHAIENRTDFFVRVVNFAGTLLGFVPPQAYCPIGLSDNSTSAGAWDIVNLRKDGISSQLNSSTIVLPQTNAPSAIDMDGDIEIVYGYRASDSFLTAVAHRSSTGAYGTPVVVRSAAVATRAAAIKHTATQALFVSCTATTAFEAVIVSLDTSTLALTVNTAATATLSANIDYFLTFSALTAIPSLPNSFVVGYCLSGGANSGPNLRPLSISGTTITLGTESRATGTFRDPGNGIAQATGDKILFASCDNTTVNVTVQIFTVSGSTLTAGTAATDSTGGSGAINKLAFFPLGSRWGIVVGKTSTAACHGYVVTLTGTTITISATSASLVNQGFDDVIVISSSKALVVNNRDAGSARDINILTDTAGTASAGTILQGNSGTTTRRCLWANASTAAIAEGAAGALTISILDVSGASPTFLRRLTTTLNSSPAPSAAYPTTAKGPNTFYASTFARKLVTGTGADVAGIEVTANGVAFTQASGAFGNASIVVGRGDRERWIFDGVGQITKLECAA